MPLRVIELTFLVLVLIGLGVVHFSRLTPHERALIQMEACLEQLYLFEKAYFAKHGHYFDPNDKGIRRAWWQIEGYTWEFWPIERQDSGWWCGPTWMGTVSLGLGL